MKDQAQKLRNMIEEAQKNRREEERESLKSLKESDSRIIAFSSGKGGVGKTSLSVNLAISLAKRGKEVYIIDADLGLANVDVLLGLIPSHTLFHIVNSEKSIDEVVMEGPAGIKIVSGGSGISELSNMSRDRLFTLIRSFEILNDRADYIFVDTGAGISDAVLSFIKSANDLFVVVSPDPASIMDAYALLKNIEDDQRNIYVIVNSARSKKEADEVFERLNIVCDSFLNIKIQMIGHVLEDENVKNASRQQKAFYLAYPKSAASKCIDLISHRIEKNEDEEEEEFKNLRFTSFVSKFLSK